MGSAQREEPDPLDPDIIQRLDNTFSYRDIPERYYTDEDGDEVRKAIVSRRYASMLSWVIRSVCQACVSAALAQQALCKPSRIDGFP